MLPVDAGEIVGIFRDHFQPVIRRSCHKMAFKHIRNLAHCLLKSVKNLVGLPSQGNFHKYRRRTRKLPGVQQCDIIADYTDRFETLHATMAGTGRQIHTR